jgi:hypothetical protein
MGVNVRVSKRNFARRNNTVLGSKGQTETLELTDIKYMLLLYNEMMAFLVTM